MKKLIISCLLSVLFLSTAYAQYGTARTGYEGDYFSLEGALDLFKQSFTLRDFERKLNTEEHWVNNLDLNYDGRIDYIRVKHRQQGNFHAIILQAVVGRYDVQDVAVIEIEVIGNREAILQIVGDEDLYGEEVIVEPVEGYSDSRSGYHPDYGGFVNVYYWEPVRYILGRQYRVYVSPYRWQYYPTWWRPWVQCSWSIFRPRIVIYQQYYHVVHRHRVIQVHHFYRPYRAYSYNVVQRANKVRIEHGRRPIHRPAPVARQERRPGEYLRRNDGVEQPRNYNRSNSPRQNPSLSRKRTLPPAEQKETRRTTPQVEQPSSTTTPRSRTAPRSATPARRPSASSRTATPSSSSANRSTTPSVRQPSRNTTTRSSTTTRSGTTTRPTTPARRPSASSRTAPASQPKANRSTPPSVRQPSRNTTTRPKATPRSKTTTPSATPARRPSAGSRSAAPASKPKATRSSTSKRSSSKSPSRKRGGGLF